MTRFSPTKSGSCPRKNINTYGPRQSARAVIPTIIGQIAAGKKQIRLGDLTPTRDFNYVIDTCRGFIALAESDKTIGEVINIGSGVEISVGDTLNLIKKIMDSDVEFITDEQRLRPEKSEVFRLCCDNTKIHELTAMVKAIRNIEKALGSGIKKPSPSELKNKPIARKSIVAAKNIQKGEPFTQENLTAKRPGTGISPMRWDEILGKYAQKKYIKDELI